jgi:hypothetical protein
MATMKERIDQHDKQLARHDKEIAAIRALVKEGMRLVILTRQDIRKLAKMQLETAGAQKETAVSLKAFMASMRGGNGHAKN